MVFSPLGSHVMFVELMEQIDDSVCHCQCSLATATAEDP